MRQRNRTVGAVLVAIAAACSGRGEAPACPDPTAGAEMRLLDFEYAPGCLQVEGAEVTLANGGDVPHTFTIPDSDIDVRLDARERGSADLSGLAPGTYRVMCTLHPQMTAAILIG